MSGTDNTVDVTIDNVIYTIEKTKNDGKMTVCVSTPIVDKTSDKTEQQNANILEGADQDENTITDQNTATGTENPVRPENPVRSENPVRQVRPENGGSRRKTYKNQQGGRRRAKKAKSIKKMSKRELIQMIKSMK